MKHVLQLTMALSAVFSLTVLLVLSTNVQGQSLQQSAALTAAELGPATVGKDSMEIDSQVTPTGCCDGGSGNCGNHDCGSGCSGEPVCCPKRVVKEVEKKCWVVKSAFVCVPSFRWPWQCRDQSKQGCDTDCGCAGDRCCGNGCSGCPPKCGRVRRVNVLEKHKYTCQECGYEWNVKCARHDNRCSHQDKSCPECGCNPGCGVSALLNTTNQMQPTASTVSVPTERTANKPPSARLKLREWLGLK